MTQSQLRKIFQLTAVGIFIYLGIRSFTVPISHDEAATFFHYIQAEKFLPYEAHWDANNHFLNSLLVYPLYKLFGSHIFWLRLPNLLFFIVYAYFGFRITKPIIDNFIRLSTSIALITAPYLIEFFAQSRGYGLSLALLFIFLYWVNQFLISKRPSHQLFALIFMALAVSANMALLNTFIIALGGIAIYILTSINGRYKAINMIYFLIFGCVPFGAATKLAFDMKEKDLLYYGKQDGFIETTVNSLLQKEFFLNSITAAWIISILGLIAAVIVLIPFVKEKFKYSNPGVVAAIFLLGNAAGSILLNKILGVNFPQDRVALYFMPLYILTIAYCIFHISQNYLHLTRYSAIVFANFPIAFVLLFNLNHTIEWNIYPVSNKAFNYFKNEQLNSSQPLIISGDRLLEMSWGYHNVRSTEIMPPFAHDSKDSLHLSDFILCHPSKCNRFNRDYDLVFQDRSHMKILKRKNKLHLDTIFNLDEPLQIEGNQEFINFIDTRDLAVLLTANVLEMEVNFSSSNSPLDVNIVITGSNEENDKLFYDFIPIKWIRNSWNGETLHFRRPVYIPPNTERLLIYAWNINGVNQKLNLKSLTLYRGSTHDQE